jgi:hypothetical protein
MKYCVYATARVENRAGDGGADRDIEREREREREREWGGVRGWLIELAYERVRESESQYISWAGER